MRRSLLLAFCFAGLLLAPMTGFGRYLKSDFHELDHDTEFAVARQYVVHVPAGYDGSSSLPVVLNFHGRGGIPGTVARQSQMNAAADRYHFMVVYPEGIGQPDNGSFNAGRCCGVAAQQRIDDVANTRQILDDVSRRYAIDRKRIYATGMSNGASMAFRLACELSDRIAAVGPVSGNMGVEGPVPSRPVPVICFYGMKDPYMSYPVILKTIEWWIRVNHCRSVPVEVVKKSDYVMERYEPASGEPGASVVFYKVTDGGHTWPGGVDINKGPGAGPTVASVPASDLLWRFFARHPLVEREEIIQ